MRPPALDELGLVPALRQRARRVQTADGRALVVAVEAPDTLPELSAAVETAAYRIALEALTNAARHSGSDAATLRIGLADGRLRVAVRDGGHGAHDWTPGVGLASMRERAAEVGGTFRVIPGADGSLVEALLPLG
jgi:signal transduction histidine kinase